LEIASKTGGGGGGGVGSIFIAVRKKSDMRLLRKCTVEEVAALNSVIIL
jgi:hypothetical protein